MWGLVKKSEIGRMCGSCANSQICVPHIIMNKYTPITNFWGYIFMAEDCTLYKKRDKLGI